MRSILLLVFIFSTLQSIHSQIIEPDLHDASKWVVVNREVKPLNESGKRAVAFNGLPGDGAMVLKDYEFSNGVIEFDVKGKNVLQESFVGIAFHRTGDKAFDAIYFRPFNFKSTDDARRSHSVQYISMPGYDWEKLRTEFPGKYEDYVDPSPDPDSWFHVKVLIKGKHISVYVNSAAKPVLEVDKLNNTDKGAIALWVGNNSDGSFANLKISADSGTSSVIPYGNNPAAGNYVSVGDAKLYYEVYGKGKPLVMLHGGVYGYIDEFEPFITKLAEKYQVICIATRGHGKSEIGHTPFSYQQRAEDAYKVIRSITNDSTIVLGFSDGGYTAMKLAALHPQLIMKLIVIGAGDLPKLPAGKKRHEHYTPERLMKYDEAFFKARLALMPEPKRWGESLNMINKMYDGDFMSAETFRNIKCPALIMSGDKDEYASTEAFVKCKRAIANAQLSVIPGCGHVVFYCNFPAVWASIQPFLEK